MNPIHLSISLMNLDNFNTSSENNPMDYSQNKQKNSKKETQSLLSKSDDSLTNPRQLEKANLSNLTENEKDKEKKQLYNKQKQNDIVNLVQKNEQIPQEENQENNQDKRLQFHQNHNSFGENENEKKNGFGLQQDWVVIKNRCQAKENKLTNQEEIKEEQNLPFIEKNNEQEVEKKQQNEIIEQDQKKNQNSLQINPIQSTQFQQNQAQDQPSKELISIQNQTQFQVSYIKDSIQIFQTYEYTMDPISAYDRYYIQKIDQQEPDQNINEVYQVEQDLSSSTQICCISKYFKDQEILERPDMKAQNGSK